MWNNQDESAYAGGFYEPSKTDSPSTDKKDGPKKVQSITPVVISMIHDCPTEEFAIWGIPTNILKFVCIVRKFDVTSTTVTYQIEDHTGRINAVLWLEHDSATAPHIPVDKENIYCRVFGTMRVKDKEKLIMILNIAPIARLNEITTHLYDVILVRTLSEKKAAGEANKIRTNNPGAELTNSMMSYAGGGSCMDEEGMTPIQRNVFRFMKSVNSSVGISKRTILDNFPPNQKKNIEDALRFLGSEGHIFSTIDSDHFQLTNSEF